MRQQLAARSAGGGGGRRCLDHASAVARSGHASGGTWVLAGPTRLVVLLAQALLASSLCSYAPSTGISDDCAFGCCPPGLQQWQISSGQTTLTECTSTVPWVGRSGWRCWVCDPGCYKADQDDYPNYMAACLLCPVGTYTIDPGSAACTPCPLGTTTAATGRTSAIMCSACAAGYIGTPSNPGVDATGCSICGIGQYSVSSSSCVPCPAGTTTAQSGATIPGACNTCAANFGGTPTNPGVNANGCVPLTPTASTTTSASTSSAATTTSSLSATQTSSSSSTATATPSGRVRCTAGFHSSSGFEPCIPCSPGTYSEATMQQTCKLCPAGTFGSSAGLATSACSGACASCAAGSTLAAAAICPAGFASGGTGVCSSCSPGTYSLAGAPSCTLCPPGTFGGAAGLSTAACSGACTGCPAGTAIPPQAAALSCVPADERAVPAALGVQLWPAAHPANLQRADLVIAPLALCQQMTSATACAAAASVVGTDNVIRYVVGTAESMNIEATEMLECRP